VSVTDGSWPYVLGLICQRMSEPFVVGRSGEI